MLISYIYTYVYLESKMLWEDSIHWEMGLTLNGLGSICQPDHSMLKGINSDPSLGVIYYIST